MYFTSHCEHFKIRSPMIIKLFWHPEVGFPLTKICIFSTQSRGKKVIVRSKEPRAMEPK